MRNLKKVVPFDLPLDNSRAKSLLDRAITLKSSIDKNEVPDPIGATDDQCHWCLFKTYCQNDKCKQVLPPWEKPKKVKAKKKDSPTEVEKPQRKAVFLL